jgi:hypothetical protein
MAPQGATTWEAYRSASRAGRGKPLSVAQRKQVWDAIAPVPERWQRQGPVDLMTLCGLTRVALDRDRTPIGRALPGLSVFDRLSSTVFLRMFSRKRERYYDCCQDTEVRSDQLLE